MNRILRPWVAAAGMAVLACHVPSDAQVPARTLGPRVPALVAFVDTLPQDVPRFRILRDGVRDVILLPPDADAELLTLAVEALGLARSQSPTGQLLLRVGGAEAAGAAGNAARRVLPWAGRVLADARNAREQHVPGVGRVRAVQIWLPRLNARPPS